MMRCVLMTVAAGVAWMQAGVALAAPQQLYNKTIVISTTVTARARADDGSYSTSPRTIQRTLYVSNKGRVFVRVQRQTARFSTTNEIAPEKTGGSLHFQGSRLVGVLRFPSGAAQMVVNFDSSFSSCTVNVIFGRESGRAIRFKGLNGKMYTQEGAFTVSGQSCSIRDGNPFAG